MSKRMGLVIIAVALGQACSSGLTPENPEAFTVSIDQSVYGLADTLYVTVENPNHGAIEIPTAAILHRRLSDGEWLEVEEALTSRYVTPPISSYTWLDGGASIIDTIPVSFLEVEIGGTYRLEYPLKRGPDHAVLTGPFEISGG